MANNFTIRSRRDNGSLHLFVKGDFDGSSACILFNALKKNWDDCNKIFVHTQNLQDIHPFGQAVFQGNLPHLRGGLTNLFFTGESGSEIAPEYSVV